MPRSCFLTCVLKGILNFLCLPGSCCPGQGVAVLGKNWKKIQSELKGELPPNLYRPLIGSLQAQQSDPDNKEPLVLEIGGVSLTRQLQDRYRESIQNRLRTLMGREIFIEFKPFETPNSPISLNPAYTLDLIIVGISNDLALTVVEEVARHPGRTNPLLIYGNSGLGKTHLAQGLIWKILSFQPQIQPCYVTLDDLKQELTEAIQNKKTIEFKNKYRSFDIICVEDIQALKGSQPSLQEEIYYLFNYFFEDGKQIILTSDVHIGRLGVSERLSSRLMSGLQVRIDPPDREIRRQFIRRRADEMNLILDGQMVDSLAGRFGGNLRRLESVLNKLYFINIKGLDITDPAILNSQLNELISDLPTGPLPVDVIIDTVSERFKISRDDVLGNSRKSEYTLPRHIAMYLSVKYSGLNKSAIARCFRKNDHSTVINAEKNIIRRLKKEPGFRFILEGIVDKLGKSSDGFSPEC